MKQFFIKISRIDSKGAFLPSRKGWYIVPCSRTRDSEALEESNFESALNQLGGEGNNVEVHRFKHWGFGWYENILVRGDTPQYEIAEGIESALKGYPVLDEIDYCKREWQESEE